MKTPLDTRTLPKASHTAGKVVAALLALLLNACGGGDTDPGSLPGNGNPNPDAGTPQVSAVQIGTPAGGRVTLRATATDDAGVTGFCFRSDATAPAASDACFQAAATFTVDVSATHATWRAYARDAAGHVSAAFDQLVDLQAPVVTALAPIALASGLVSMKISASDSHSVGAVCLRADTAMPLANDPCFTVGDTVSVAAVVGSVSYRAYARDGSGNVSAALARDVDV